MSSAHPPSVFVSSTCYDLAQVRQDLRVFIESLGYQPMMSEFSSFPVNPSLDAVGNCLSAVRDSADILVLVVGGRYGSRADNNKSITNLEYLEAKAKAIPVYVFVLRPILTALTIWKKNPEGDFTDVVDSTQLFDFVESLRDPKESWVFPFETAQEIIDVLRKQLAYLFNDALNVRAKLLDSGVPDSIKGLSGKALGLAIRKPFAWEYRLFIQVFSDEIARHADTRRDLKYHLALGKSVALWDRYTLASWIQTKIGEIRAFIESADRIVKISLIEAVGAPGEPGNVEHIVYTARQLGNFYRRLLEWSSEFRCVQTKDEFRRLVELVSRFPENIIQEMEDMSRTALRETNEAVARYEQTKEPQSVNLTLKFTAPDMSEFNIEMDRVSRIYD